MSEDVVIESYIEGKLQRDGIHALLVLLGKSGFDYSADAGAVVTFTGPRTQAHRWPKLEAATAAISPRQGAWWVIGATTDAFQAPSRGVYRNRCSLSVNWGALHSVVRIQLGGTPFEGSSDEVWQNADRLVQIVKALYWELKPSLIIGDWGIILEWIKHRLCITPNARLPIRRVADSPTWLLVLSSKVVPELRPRHTQDRQALSFGELLEMEDGGLLKTQTRVPDLRNLSYIRRQKRVRVA